MRGFTKVMNGKTTVTKSRGQSNEMVHGNVTEELEHTKKNSTDTPLITTEESMDSMRTWLSITKQGRIVHQDPQRIREEFEDNKALWKSLDLQEITEEEINELVE